jgi:hypothetical protein
MSWLSDIISKHAPSLLPPKEYQTLAFKDSDAMKEWLTKKTLFYINLITPYRGPIKVGYEEFQVVRKNYGNYYTEETKGGYCRQMKVCGKIVSVVINYNPLEAGQMCRDCLENVVIHEVTHINFPNHEPAFYAAYFQAVHDKNERDNGGYFPITGKCKYCQHKLKEYMDNKKIISVKKYPV